MASGAEVLSSDTSSSKSPGSGTSFVPAPLPTKNAWGLKSSVDSELEKDLNKPLSLHDVMSEQLAAEMMKKELHNAPSEVEVPDIPMELLTDTHQFLPPDDCADDFLIAQMLQMQFDREYDSAISKEEQHQNKTSKVSVSYSKYRVIPDNPIWDDSDEEEDEYFIVDDRKRHCDIYETHEKEIGALPKCGYKKIGDKIITKHDKVISQRANGRRIMEFPPGIATGDGGGIDMQLSNRVYNSIRNFSIKEGKRKHRVQDKEDKSTAVQAVDQNTRILLFKMINNGLLESINGIISTGKEAVIMHAYGDGEEIEKVKVPKECAIKVFKTSLNEFKTRDKYIKDDNRFKDRFGKQNPRKIVHIWAEKELHNLLKMRRQDVNVPEPVILKKHVLVMSFIGQDGQPAPKIKDAALSTAELEVAYDEVVSMMKKLYNECKLVHADLSEYNILWHDEKCWFIDVSQSVEPGHPHGLEFLMRDCINVVGFFSKKGVAKPGTPQDLFTEITGLTIDEDQTEAEIICQVREYQKKSEILHDIANPEDDDSHFAYCWDESSTSSTKKTAAQPIPGQPRSGKNVKSPKSYMNFPAKSPKPKSPGSANLMSLTDEELRAMKAALAQEDGGEDSDGHTAMDKKTVVKFAEES